MDENNNFGMELKQTRKSHNLTIRKLAKLAGTSHSYLSQIENNRVNPPKPEMIKKIAKGLSNNDESKYKTLSNILMEKAGYVSVEDYSDLSFFILKKGDREEVKKMEDTSKQQLSNEEILRQQLQLLAERAQTALNEELPSLTNAMLEIVKFLK